MTTRVAGPGLDSYGSREMYAFSNQCHGKFQHFMLEKKLADIIDWSWFYMGTKEHNDNNNNDNNHNNVSAGVRLKK